MNKSRQITRHDAAFDPAYLRPNAQLVCTLYALAQLAVDLRPYRDATLQSGALDVNVVLGHSTKVSLYSKEPG